MIAFFSDDRRGGADRMLAELARQLEDRGLRLAGAVQENTEAATGPCDMDLRVLGADELVRISQSLGAGANGCRLDPDGLARAAAMAEAVLAGADLVLVNKFGAQESEGGGFRPLIAQAVGAGIPVLIAVGRSRRAAFDAFAAGEAGELSATVPALLDWCLRMAAGRV